MKDRVDKSRGIVTFIAEAFVKIKDTLGVVNVRVRIFLSRNSTVCSG
jgi:hypothetical protein